MDTPAMAKNVTGWLPGRPQNRGAFPICVHRLLNSLFPVSFRLKHQIDEFDAEYSPRVCPRTKQ